MSDWQRIADTPAPTDRHFEGHNGVRQVVASWWPNYREGEGEFADAHGNLIVPPLTHWSELRDPPA